MPRSKVCTGTSARAGPHLCQARGRLADSRGNSMDCSNPKATRPRMHEHVREGFRWLSVIGLSVIIVAGLIGQMIRDRSVAFAVLMYLPLLPAGLTAIAFDLILRGRAIPRARFGLAFLGMVASIWTLVTMIGLSLTTEPVAGSTEISLLHWNIQWGGGLFRSQQTWAAQRSEILRRDPDIIVLSELPPVDWMTQLVDDMGAGASTVYLAHDRSSRHEFRMAVCSRWPIQLNERVSLPGGAGMSVTAEVRGRRLRLLCVDGQSNPFRSRLPFLVAITDLCSAASAAGRPFDLVVGDFNTPARSLGFDAMMDQGYTLASKSDAGWRGTFPSWLPLYDIDHVWLGPALDVRSCRLFNGPATDHRGQFVRFGSANVAQQATDGRFDSGVTPDLSVPRRMSNLARRSRRAGARQSGASASLRKLPGSAE
jgi:endonuclease/exonuclease/phosphatase family metal-dependent hydrolase